MLWKIWVGVGAITTGILLAAVLGGGTPPVAGAVLLITLFLGGGATLLALRNPRRGLDPTRGTATPSKGPANNGRDGDLVRHVHEVIGTSDITWLRNTNFGVPWRDPHVAAFRQLEATDIGYVAHDFELRDAVDRLMTATIEFLELYDQTTIEDPMMLDATWRIVGDPSDPEGKTRTDRRELDAHVHLLGQAAREICETYDELSAAGKSKFGITLD
jgi:hypothetical protein